MSYLAGKAAIFAASFSINPSGSAPGVSGIRNLTNDIAEYALLACGIGAVGSLFLMALSKGFHLERLSTHGREGVIVSLVAAFLVGAVGAFLNAAYSL